MSAIEILRSYKISKISCIESASMKNKFVDTISIGNDILKVYCLEFRYLYNSDGKVAHDLAFYLGDIKIGDISISAVDSKNAFLYNFEVKTKYRGKGYGSKILEYVLSHYNVNKLTVAKENNRAIKLYKRYGFKVNKEFIENGISQIDMRIKID